MNKNQGRPDNRPWWVRALEFFGNLFKSKAQIQREFEQSEVTRGLNQYNLKTDPEVKLKNFIEEADNPTNRIILKDMLAKGNRKLALAIPKYFSDLNRKDTITPADMAKLKKIENLIKDVEDMTKGEEWKIERKGFANRNANESWIQWRTAIMNTINSLKEKINPSEAKAPQQSEAQVSAEKVLPPLPPTPRQRQDSIDIAPPTEEAPARPSGRRPLPEIKTEEPSKEALARPSRGRGPLPAKPTGDEQTSPLPRPSRRGPLPKKPTGDVKTAHPTQPSRRTKANVVGAETKPLRESQNFSKPTPDTTEPRSTRTTQGPKTREAPVPLPRRTEGAKTREAPVPLPRKTQGPETRVAPVPLARRTEGPKPEEAPSPPPRRTHDPAAGRTPPLSRETRPREAPTPPPRKDHENYPPDSETKVVPKAPPRASHRGQVKQLLEKSERARPEAPKVPPREPEPPPVPPMPGEGGKGPGSSKN